MLRMTMAAIAAVVLMAPALAHGATLHGTVAAKQANRHVLVVALPNGNVVSARVSPRQLHSTRVGTRLSLGGKRLADGSLRVTRMRRLGSAKRARLSVVVLKSRTRRLLVAGGGSAFSIRLAHPTPLAAGKNVQASVTLSSDGPTATDVQATGDAPLIDFSGVVTAIGSTSFTVTSDGIATTVQLPDGVVLPAIVQVGSEVEVVAAISGSTLTLATIKLDGEHEGDDGGSDVDNQGRVRVEGSVTAFGGGSVTVQPGDNASPVTFTVPDGFTLPSTLAVGSVVEARGELVNGVLTLTRVELKNEDGDSGDDGGGGGGGDGGGGDG